VRLSPGMVQKFGTVLLLRRWVRITMSMDVFSGLATSK
jgi:hypothetical protein